MTPQELNGLFMEQIGKKMEAKGINQASLASKIGKTRNVLANYFTGEELVDIPTLAKIAEVLEVEILPMLNTVQKKYIPLLDSDSESYLHTQFGAKLLGISNEEAKVMELDSVSMRGARMVFLFKGDKITFELTKFLHKDVREAIFNDVLENIRYWKAEFVDNREISMEHREESLARVEKDWQEYLDKNP